MNEFSVNDYIIKVARLFPEPLYSHLKRVYRRIRKRSEGYYCRALAGESNYNICINSDMTVSCNCADYDGSGHIGDLKKQTLQEIFDGEIACRFRSQLALGELPISNCLNCPELIGLPKSKAESKVHEYSLPHKGIMVENTVACNLECLACDRSVVNTRSKRIMSLDDIRVVANIIRNNSIEQVCYHNLGEPFLSKRIFDELKIIRDCNPDTTLVLSTNGVYLDSLHKRQAALYLDHIYFSIDGASQESMKKYQIGGDFEKSVSNMASLVELRDSLGRTRPIIEWKYVVFEWNDSQEEIRAAICLARNANVDIISFMQGGMPGKAGISSRYATDPFFKHLGEESWKGREVILRDIHPNQHREYA